MSLNTSINPINGYQSMLNRSQLNGDIFNVNNLTVNNSFKNQGTTSLVGSLDVSGISTFENNVIIKANISIHGNIDVSGNIDFNNDVDILGNLDVSGISTFNNDVNVNADMTVENLDVSGTLTVNNITLANNLDVSGNLTVEGTSTFKNLVSILNIDPSLLVQSTGNAGMVINSNSDGSGSSYYNYVAFRSNNADKLIIGYDDATGNGEINKNSSSIDLDIFSNTTFKQSVNINNDLDVSGQINALNIIATDISCNNLNVSTNTNLNNLIFNDASGDTLHLNNLIFNDASGDTLHLNTIDVSNIFIYDLSANTINANYLNVSNNSIMNNILCQDISANRINSTNDIVSTGTITGSSLYSNNDTITGTLDVSGATTLHSTLDVSGIATFNNISNFNNTISCDDVSGHNFTIYDISGNNANFNNGYFTNLTTNDIYIQNIDISGYIEIANSSPGFAIGLTKTLAMIKNVDISVYGQNTANLYGYNIGFGDKLYMAKYDGTFHDALTIDSSLNIGIGTTVPTEKLQIDEGKLFIRHYAGTPGSYNTIITDISGTGDTIISMTGAGPTSSSFVGIGMASYYGRTGGASSAVYAINNNNFSSHLGFFTADEGAIGTNTLSERMRIDTRGYIGIGITTPSEKLTVNNGNIVVRSDDSNIIFQNFDISGSGTEFGAHVIQRNFSERYAGACWSDVGSGIMTLNRYNSYQIKYYNSASFSANGTYFPTTNWSTTPSNGIDNAFSSGTYSIQRSFSTVGTYFNPGRIRYDGAVSKYFQVVATGQINDAGQLFFYGYMDHYDSSTTTSTKVAGNIIQYLNTANFTMTAVVLLDNLDEIRLFFYTGAGTSTSAVVMSISIAEIF